MTQTPSFEARQTQIIEKADYFVGKFLALGCPCEVLIETRQRAVAKQIVPLIRNEAWRIEALWSRYLPTSLVQQLNSHAGQTMDVDPETARLLEFCAELWRLSDAAFDITSGVLREVWQFDGSVFAPDANAIADVMQRVGWHRVSWNNPSIRMQLGMQIDFGGAGKEYAVDLCCARLRDACEQSCLVNFGGDVAVSRPPSERPGWSVGVESINASGRAEQVIQLAEGGLASSGNVHRYVLHQGKRLSHILDSRTGWPVEDAPASVTVRAATCTEAGMFATLSALQGSNAEIFLANEGVEHWVQR